MPRAMVTNLSHNGEGSVVVVGGGLVGSLCTLMLLRKGFSVHVYDRNPDIRVKHCTGKSINLVMTNRGFRAIRALGGTVYEDIKKISTKTFGRIIHPLVGDPLYQRYGRDDSDCNFSISRHELNVLLMKASEKEGAVYHFEHKLREVSGFQGEEGLALIFSRGDHAKLRVRTKCPVFGCDGAGSKLRREMQRVGLANFSEDVLFQGYKEVMFPVPAPGEDFGVPATADSPGCDSRSGLHIWPREDHMLMALANRDGSFTGTFYTKNEGPEDSFEVLTDSPEGREKLLVFCTKYYSDAARRIGGMDELVRKLATNPAGKLRSISCDNWVVGGSVVLLGDAAHAMVPFFGQGCNCGFEDVLCLAQLLDRYICVSGTCCKELCTAENFAIVFKSLFEQRKPNTDAICAMAEDNFAEMRAKTADANFLAVKKLENRLENAFPLKFRSRYAMVCYGGDGNVTYSAARSLGLVQDEVLRNLLAKCKGDDQSAGIISALAAVGAVDLEEAERMIDEKIVPIQRDLGVDLSAMVN